MERKVMKTGWKLITMFAVALFMLAVTAGIPVIAEKNAGYITIDMQGHGTNRTVESGTMTSLEAIVANAFDGQDPTAEGYEFACFSLNPMADNPTEEQVQQAHDSFYEATVSEYTTVYVVWRQLYTVTINMQGKGNNRTVKAAYGRWLNWVVDSAFSGQEPTAEGYECAGFSLSATNLNPTEEQVHQAHDSYDDATVSGDTTIYVMWRELCSVTIDMHGHGENKTVKVGKGLNAYHATGRAFNGQNPTAEGYEFICYSLTNINDNPDNDAAHNADIAFYDAVLNGDTTIYVIWKTKSPFMQTGDNEYTIYTAAGWDVFCECLNDNETYNRFSGKTVKLDADISVTRMAGSSQHDFCGTFDGNYHTLTFAPSGTQTVNGAAPFSYVSTVTPENGSEIPAAFRNLNVVSNFTTSGENSGGLVGRSWGTVSITGCTVSGTINTSNKYTGGFMGYPSGTTSITDSTSSITINSSVNGDGTHAGFIGTAGTNTVSIKNCVFDGSIVSASGVVTDSCGGFVGWKGGTVSITNCRMAADMSTIGDASDTDYPSCTFVRPNSNVTVTNSYYTVPFGIVQGEFIGQLTLPEGVIASAAEGDTVTYDKKTWYIGGKTVTLTVTPPEGNVLAENGLTYTYTAPNAEQSTTTALNAVWNGSDGVYTATYTMPASDVTVTATFTRTVFSVFFDNDDGNMTEQNVSLGGKITKPDDPVSPYGPGYTFGGWYAVKDGVEYECLNEGGWCLIFENGEGSYTYPIPSILNTWEITDENGTAHSSDEYLRLWDFDTDTVTKDMCLFARWKRVYSVSVANNIENGTVLADHEQATEGETVTLTVNPANGYALGTLTVDQQDVTTGVSNGVYAFQMPGHAVMVTATFTRTVFSVFFDNDDGNMTEQNVSLGGKITKPDDPVSPYGSGYIFSGWYAVKDGVEYDCLSEEGWCLIFENGDESYTYPIPRILNTWDTWEITDENGTAHSSDEYLRLWDFDTDTVTKDMCLFARWKRVYSVSVANNIENGTVQADKDQAMKGETVTLTVTPASGYTLETLTVDQQDVTAGVSNGVYAFQMPDHAVTVTATFTRVYYTITLHCPSLCATMTATVNGQSVDLPAFVDNEATIQAGEGDTVALTVIPNDAYRVDSFEIYDPVDLEFLDVTFSDGENGSKTATFAMPAMAVRASVNIQSNDIQSEAFYDGETVLFAVTPSKNPAKAGETITLTVTKDAAVTLDALALRYWDQAQNEEVIQNLEPDVGGVYSFTMPDTSVEIRSKIRLTGRKYAINRTGLSDEVGVKVICSRNEYNMVVIEATSANEGDTVGVFANGVTLTGFSVTGADNEPIETAYSYDWYEPYYSFTMPAQNVTVTGTAAYSIRLPYEEELLGGSLSVKVNGKVQQPDDNNTVAAQAGDSIIVTATPNEGYRLINLSYSGMSQGGDVIHKSAEVEGESTPITSGEAFTMPANNINIFARFDTPWRMLQNEIDGAQEGDTITLTEDIIATASDGALSIASWMPAITIDLNGHTIDRHLTAAEEYGYVIYVNGTLTLMDSAGGGTITGGYNSYAGGGIFVSGTLNLQGGAITGNHTDDCGGGVYMSSSNTVFNFTGGTITGNTSNRTDRKSNGVMYGDGAINVSGNPIAEDAVWIDSANETIHVTGALAQTANIDVAMWDSRVFTTGWSEKMGSADPADYFTSANPAYLVRRNASGEAELGSAAEAFGTPDFTLPAGIGTIEANAFEGMKKMTVVDARNCTQIGAEAFKGTGLKQILLPGTCQIDATAFYGLGRVYVFAPKGGSTEAFCNDPARENLIFVEVSTK